jgi:hypothetical protein
MALPTEKQIAYATKIAEKHQVPLPPECLKSSFECGRWIDEHLEHKAPTAKQLEFGKELAHKLNITLGTDTLSSGLRLSMWIKANQGKVLDMHPRDIEKPLSTKQMAIIAKHAPEIVIADVEAGNYQTGRNNRVKGEFLYHK